jgi:hypothetical protein
MDAEGYLIDRLYDDLIEVWRELKEYGLEGPVRSGIMHEVLYWVASLRAQKQADRVFFIAPIHEGIPRLIHTKKLEAEEERQEEFQFRGDFCIFWGIASKEAQTAVVDVKSDYGTAIGDGKLLRTVKQFHRLGLQFFVASPEPKIEDFEYMKKERYLLDLRKWWSHRPLQLDGYTSGPYPESIAPPWLLNP